MSDWFRQDPEYSEAPHLIAHTLRVTIFGAVQVVLLLLALAVGTWLCDACPREGRVASVRLPPSHAHARLDEDAHVDAPNLDQDGAFIDGLGDRGGEGGDGGVGPAAHGALGRKGSTENPPAPLAQLHTQLRDDRAAGHDADADRLAWRSLAPALVGKIVGNPLLYVGAPVFLFFSYNMWSHMSTVTSLPMSAFHASCALSGIVDATSSDCASAARRLCKAVGHISTAAGLIVDLHGPSLSVTVLCLENHAFWYDPHVSIASLQPPLHADTHGPCTNAASQGWPCTMAVHNHCQRHSVDQHGGGDGVAGLTGFPQEVGKTEFGIACVKPSPGFRLLQHRVSSSWATWTSDLGVGHANFDEACRVPRLACTRFAGELCRAYHESYAVGWIRSVVDAGGLSRVARDNHTAASVDVLCGVPAAVGHAHTVPVDVCASLAEHIYVRYAIARLVDTTAFTQWAAMTCRQLRTSGPPLLLFVISTVAAALILARHFVTSTAAPLPAVAHTPAVRTF